MKDIKGELIVSFILVLLLGVMFNPWNMAMPDYLITSLLIGLIVLFSIFAVFVWREKKGDEREQLHRFFADRVGYLAGSAFLVIGVVVQEIDRTLDGWLIFVLAIMILGKVVGLIYGKKNL